MASNGKWPNRQPNGENTTICLKRIPISLTDCEIKKLTDPYGQVDSITWLKHNLHSRFTMAFIVYSTSSQCKLALTEISRRKPYGIECGWATRERRYSENSSVSNNRNTMDVTDSSLSLNQEIPTCARCQQTDADFACGKCGEWYCSKKCQSADWNRHKKECFEMPPLIPIKSRSTSQFNVSMSSTRLQRASDNVDTVDNEKLAKKSERLSNGEPDQKPIAKNGPGHGNGVHLQRVIHQEVQREVVAKPQEPERAPLEKPKQIETATDRAPLQKTNPITEVAAVNTSNRGSDQPPVESVKQNETSRPPRSILTLRANRPAQPSQPSPPIKSAPAKDLSPEQPLITSGTKVKVSFVVSHDSVYVIPLKHSAEYFSILNEVNDYAKSQQPITDVYKGLYAAGPLKSGTYARVIVLNEQGNKAGVAFIDYGNVTELDKSVLRPLSDELIVKNRYSRKIQIKDITDDFDCPEFVAFLQKMKGDKMLFELHYDGEFDQKTPCQLIGEEGKTLRQMFIADLNPPVEKSNNEVKVDSSDVPTKKISGANVQMTILDRSLLNYGIVSALLIADLQLFGENDAKINEYCEKLPNIECKPRTGGLCFALWGDGVEEPRWYRGHCIQYENDKPQILFIDYGNYEAIDIKNIRAAPEEFYFECITASIILGDVPVAGDGSVSSKIQQFLNDNLPETITFDKIVYNEDDQTSMAYSSEIVKLLKDAKFI